MATTVKTIEYAFPLSTGAVNSATARDFTSITIYIPETPTFKSVILETSSHSWNGTQSVTAVLMGISLGAVARNDTTVTQTIVNSAENYSFIFTRDVTSYFQTNWTGTNMAAGCRLTVTGPATASATAKLIITYTFDDTSATTRIKTVRIPIDGNTGGLTTNLTNVGGISNQIPNLSTFLPENSVVIRDIFFETYTHTGAVAGTTDIAMNLRFDGTNTLSTTYEGGATTDYSIKRIDKSLTLFNTGATSNVEASTGNVATPFTCLGGIIYVTYEYNHTNSTTILNSLMMPVIDGHGWTGGNTETESDVFTFDLNISEPGTITLLQSGVLISTSDSGAIDLNVRIGDQTARTFSHPASLRSGNVFQTRRFDSGAAGDPSNLALGFGVNTITIRCNTTGTTLGTFGSNLTGIMIINYTSGKDSKGDGAHNKTTLWITHAYSVDAGAREIVIPDRTVSDIADQNGYYYLISAGFMVYLQTSSAPTSTIPINLKFFNDIGDTPPEGYTPFFDTMYVSDDEIGMNIMWSDSTYVYNNGYELDGLIVTTPRNILISNSPDVCLIQIVQIVTSNNITFSYSGTVSGADGQNVNLLLYDDNQNKYVAFTSRYGNGTYQIIYGLPLTGFVRAQYGFSNFWVVSELLNQGDPFDINFSFAEFGYGAA